MTAASSQAPLTPDDCDLRDYPSMLLDVARLRDSGLASDETPEACWAAVLLWAASWHQVPAASIPDNDNWIAKHAGYAQRGKIDKAWGQVRAGALRHFVSCSDGRLYHPVVAEKALECWLDKLAARLSSGAGNATRWKIPFDPTPIENQIRESRRMLSALNPHSRALSKRKVSGIPSDSVGDPIGNADDIPPGFPMGSQEKDKGIEGKEKKRQKSKRVSGTPSGEPAPTAAVWANYRDAYHDRYGVEPVRNEKINGQLAQLVRRLGAEEAPHVARFFVGHQNAFYVRRMHAVDDLLRDAEKLRTEWATNRRMTNAQAIQADKTQTNANAFAPLIAEAEARERAQQQESMQ